MTGSTLDRTPRRSSQGGYGPRLGYDDSRIRLCLSYGRFGPPPSDRELRMTKAKARILRPITKQNQFMLADFLLDRAKSRSSA